MGTDLKCNTEREALKKVLEVNGQQRQVSEDLQAKVEVLTHQLS